MLNYSMPLYRPPAEAESIIIQATLGCSHNQCSFCSMYKTKRYEVRALEAVQEEIALLAQQYPKAKRIFLADGDALALPTPHLLSLLELLQQAFPNLARVSLYATAQNLLEKTEQELETLRANKLTLLYFGVETGNERLLQKIHKGVDGTQIRKALNKAKDTGFKVSATVILGLGGKDYTHEHIEDTAKLLSDAPVTYLSTLQLGLDPQIKEHFKHQFETPFTMLNDREILDEQYRLLKNTRVPQTTIFRSNHASNALALKGNLPRDTAKLLDQITQAQTIGEAALRPQWMRGF